MKYLLALTLLFSLACAGQPKYIDARLKPYYDRYMEDAYNRSASVKMSLVPFIMFKDLEPGFLGKCTVNWKSTTLEKIIYIDPGQWESLSELVRLEVIYHEMGHCAFKKFGHSDDPDSIMYKYNMASYASPVWVEANWSRRVNEYWKEML